MPRNAGGSAVSDSSNRRSRPPPSRRLRPKPLPPNRNPRRRKPLQKPSSPAGNASSRPSLPPPKSRLRPKSPPRPLPSRRRPSNRRQLLLPRRSSAHAENPSNSRNRHSLRKNPQRRPQRKRSPRLRRKQFQHPNKGRLRPSSHRHNRMSLPRKRQSPETDARNCATT